MTATTATARLLTTSELRQHVQDLTTNPDHAPGYEHLLDYLSGLHETIAALKQVAEITADPIFNDLAGSLTNAGRAAVVALNSKLNAKSTPQQPSERLPA